MGGVYLRVSTPFGSREPGRAKAHAIARRLGFASGVLTKKYGPRAVDMPTYEYESDSKRKGCKQCAQRFEVIQAISEKPLTQCPECGEPVKRVPSLPFRPQTPFMSGSNLAQKGLTKLTKNCDGKYEVSGGQKGKKGESIEKHLRGRGID